jgi:hypothetical protein
MLASSRKTTWCHNPTNPFKPANSLKHRNSLMWSLVQCCNTLWVSSLTCHFLSHHLYKMGPKGMMFFPLLLWVGGWVGGLVGWLVWGTNCCTHAVICVCSLVVMEKWLVNHCVFAVRTHFETKPVAHKDVFGVSYIIWDIADLLWGNAILKWVDDFNVHHSVVNKSDDITESIWNGQSITLSNISPPSSGETGRKLSTSLCSFVAWLILPYPSMTTSSSETLVDFRWTTWCYIPEDRTVKVGRYDQYHLSVFHCLFINDNTMICLTWVLYV